MPSNFNGTSNTSTLADALTGAPDAKGRIHAMQLEDGAARYDDFKMMEGPPGSESPFWVKRDLTKAAGDKMTFSVQSDLAGPGVIGEQELTGNTSTAAYGTYDVIVDFHRDAYEITKKQVKFLAAGESVDSHSIDKLKVKMGRWRMDEMKLALRINANGNIVRPNARKSRDTIVKSDTLSPHFLTNAAPQLTRIGGRPINVSKNKEGSPVHRHLVYASNVAMAEVRNDTTYINATNVAANRGDMNPVFTGRLVDWNGLGLFEHLLTAPDADDKLYDVTAPLAKLGTAFNVDSAHGACKLIMNSANTRSRYFEFFPGFDYQFAEGQIAAPDAGVYYAWLVNPDNSVGFVRYTGSGNNGNQITLTQILSPAGAGTSTIGAVKVGNIDSTGDAWTGTPGAGGAIATTSADFNYTSTFVAGAWIIPANANGVPIGYSFLFGKGAAVRAYAQTDTYVTQARDYTFVNGRGYQGIWGQTPVKRTDNITHGYLLMEHAISHPGLEVPALSTSTSV